VTITGYLKTFKPRSPETVTGDVRLLYNAAAYTNNHPYLSSVLPENRNVITGKPVTDMNSLMLDLTASSLRLSRTLWIYGADAALLDLSVKKPALKPLTIFYHIRTDHGPVIDAHSAYLLDQLDPASLEQSYALANPLRASHFFNAPLLSSLSKKLLRSVRDYDLSPLNTVPPIENMKTNSRSGSRGFTGASRTHNAFTGNSSPSASFVFNHCRKYFTQQLTGLPLMNCSEGYKKIAGEYLNSLAKNIPAFINCVFQAQTFSRRLIEKDFRFLYDIPEPSRASFIPVPAYLKDTARPLPQER
jgi:hypothetical protein